MKHVRPSKFNPLRILVSRDIFYQSQKVPLSQGAIANGF